MKCYECNGVLIMQPGHRWKWSADSGLLCETCTREANRPAPRHCVERPYKIAPSAKALHVGGI